MAHLGWNLKQEEKSSEALHELPDTMGKAENSVGNEASNNILGIVIKEEEIIAEEFYLSTSGIRERYMQIKEEPELDLEAEIGQLRGTEATHNILGIVIKEEKGSVTEEVHPLASGEGAQCYVCHHCQQNFAYFEQLKTHIKICFSVNNAHFSSSKAESPSPKLAVTDELHAHFNSRKVHGFTENTKITKYSCSLCSYSSPVFKMLNVHIMSEHTDNKHIFKHNNDKPYSCPYCNFSTARADNLKRHMYKHTNEKPHSCPQCCFSTVDPHGLKLHFMSKHTNEKPHSCPHCSYRTVQSSHLKSHITCKHTNERPHSCPYCNFSTARAYSLKRHIMYKHTNDKPHCCPHCNFSSVQSQDLKLHILSKHSNVKPHCCSHCNYRSVHSNALKLHIMSKHTDEKPHSCLYCSYSAVHPHSLKLHIISKHTNEKPHTCPHCDYSTVSPHDLKIHMTSVHTTVKPYPCPFCNFNTARKSRLKCHITTKHSDG